MTKKQMIMVFCATCLLPFVTMNYLLREATILNIVVLIINIVACIVFLICLLFEVRLDKKKDLTNSVDKTENHPND